MSAEWSIDVRANDPQRGSAGGDPGGWLPFRDWDWRHFAFFVGVPGAVALYAALNNWTILQLSGYQVTLLFYAAHAFVPWWTSALATQLTMRALRPWRPPQWVLLLIGSFLACLLVLPYSQWLTQYFAAGWFKGDVDGTLASSHILDQVGFWSFTLRATVIWLLANMAFDRFLGLPRYRYDVPAPAGAVAVDTPAPAPAPDAALRFLQRLPAALSAEQVLALKAEQHYIKVYTPDRSFLTLYRFSDAVAEMDPGVGRQVHRSYWVRASAIRAVHRDAGKYSLELVNGLDVPVSAAHRGMIRELARTRNIPVHPPL